MNCFTLLFIVLTGLSVNVYADTPQISQILPHETREDIAVSIPFTVTADSEIIAVTLASSNQILIPDEYLLYDNNASRYTMVATPALNQTGNARITIYVSDIDGNTENTGFDITVSDTDDSMYFWKNYQTADQSLTTDLLFPAGVFVSPFTGKIFVSDTGHNRILRFSKGQTTHEAVFGDSGDYQMDTPVGIYVDSFDRLWVADMENHRVLRFDHASTKNSRAPPDGILGDAAIDGYSGTTQKTMSSPIDVWIDERGSLWVADSENHRILRFDHAAKKENHANADAVLGQASFTEMTTGLSASQLLNPRGIAVQQGHLFVADFSHHRVLCFKDAYSKNFLANADIVLGQFDFISNEPQTSAAGMNLPSGLALDTYGRLYVSEQDNNRVLIFNDATHKNNGDSADNVLGQKNFDTKEESTSLNDLRAPYFMNINPENNHLWVPDLLNNRILSFHINLKEPPVFGQIKDSTILENTTSEPIPFTVTDVNEQSLTITYAYANASLLSSSSFEFIGKNIIVQDDQILLNATSNPSTITLKISPLLEQNGNSTITFTATDPHLMQGTQEFILNVQEVNDPPTMTPHIDNQTISEDTQSEAIHFTVADIEGNQLEIEISAANSTLFPSNTDNITLSNADGGQSYTLITDADSDALTLLMQPASNQSGTSEITVTVKDGMNTTSLQFQMTVSPVNDQPTISSIENQTILEDTRSQAIAFTVVDPEATGLTIGILSSNQNLIPSDTQHLTLNHETGAYSLITYAESSFLTLLVFPETNASGTSVITITTTDGVFNTIQSFTMTVLPVNDTPVISPIDNQTCTESTQITDIFFTVQDIDSEKLRIEIQSSNPELIPSDANHISLSTSAGDSGYTVLANAFDHLTLSLMPVEHAYGASKITVTVIDGNIQTATSFSLTVTPINDPPIISPIADQLTLEDTQIIIPFSTLDHDNDPLTLKISTHEFLIPPNAQHITLQTANDQFSYTCITIAGGEDISLTILPLLNQSGQTPITITATDGIATISESFMLTVSSVNDAPLISFIENQQTDEDTQSLPIAFTVTDVENESLTLEVVSYDQDLIPSDSNHVTLINYTQPAHSGDQIQLMLMPALNMFGSSLLAITVTDGNLASSQSFTMTVNPMNDAPIISPIANMLINEDSTSPEIFFNVADAEFDHLTIHVLSNNDLLIPSNASHINIQNHVGGNSYTLSTDPGALTLVLQPKKDQSGVAAITIQATDGLIQSSQTFKLTVSEINDLPEISLIQNQNTVEDTETAPIAFSITDIDSSPINIQIQSSNETLLPLDAQHITLCNASGGNTFTLITHKNHDSLTLTVLPASNQTGQVSLTVLVSDNQDSFSQSFVLAVTPVNDPPFIAPISDYFVDEDQHNIQIPFTVLDVDDPACSLALTVTSSNQNLIPNEQISWVCHDSSYTITLQPSQDQNGDLDIDVKVIDKASATHNQVFGLHLMPINDPPTISGPEIIRVKVNLATPVPAIWIDDIDAGSAPIAITLVSGDAIIQMPSHQGNVLTMIGTIPEINAQLNEIIYSPPESVLGYREMTLTVNDLGNSGDHGPQRTIKPFLVEIHNDNVGPVNYLPSLSMLEDESLHITPISVYDLDAAHNPIEVTLTTKNGYLTLAETSAITLLAGSPKASTQMVISASQFQINHALAFLTLTCTTHFNGWVTLTMTTNDHGHAGTGYSPHTAVNSTTITVVAETDPPGHLLPESLTLNEDSAIAFTAAVLDPDGEDTMSVDLEAGTGTLKLKSGKGLSGYLTPGQFLSFTGKKSDVNDAMNGIVYQIPSNISGTYSITMTYQDMDYPSKTVTMPVQINAINDPPQIFVDSMAITIVEDFSASISAAITDIDAAENDMLLLLTTRNAQLTFIQASGLTVVSSETAQSLTVTGAMDHINTALQELIFTPNPNFYGNTSVSITINDLGNTPMPSESDHQHISVTILPVNDPPTFHFSPAPVICEEDFSTPKVISIITDGPFLGEHEPVTYTFNPEPQTITWATMTFNPESLSLTLSAIKDRFGSQTFTVTANDGAPENNIAINHLSLTITAVNDPPSFTISQNHIVLYEDFAFAEHISLTADAVPLDEPQGITFTIEPSSLTWVNLSINSQTGHISMTHVPHGYGERHITIIANDGDITATQTFELNVIPINDPPQITSEHHFAITENTPIGTTVYTLAALDIEKQTLSWYIESISPSESFAVSPATGEIWIKSHLDYESIDSYTMTVSVSDTITAVKQTLTITIMDINDAPIMENLPDLPPFTFMHEAVDISGISVMDMDTYDHPIRLTLTATHGIVDITNTELRLESGNYSTTNLSVSGTLTAINQALTSMEFMPTPNYKGPASISIVVNDLASGNAKSVSEVVWIDVLNYNEPPIFSQYSSHLFCNEDQSVHQTIVISDADAADEAILLTMMASNGVLGVSQTQPSEYLTYTGSISHLNEIFQHLLFTPKKEFSGIAGYTLFANDLGHSGVGDPQNAEPAVITITCVAMNDAPINKLPESIMGMEDSDISVALTVNDIDAYTHMVHVQLTAYKGLLTLPLSSDLTHMTNDGIAETSISFTSTLEQVNAAMSAIIFHPETNFTGNAGITITTNDLGASIPEGLTEPETDTDFLTITVSNVNDPPDIISTPIQSVDEDHLYDYTVLALDIDMERVTYSARALPAWLTLVDHGNNTASIKGTPENAHVGETLPFTITVTDPHQAISTQVYTILVHNTNDPPEFTSIHQTEALEDHLYQYTITVNDIDPDAVISIAPYVMSDWLNLKDYGNGTALLSGIPGNEHVGINNVAILTASDGIALTIKESFSIHVHNTNDPPEIISTPVLEATEDLPYTATFTALDLDGDTVVFLPTTLPEWLTLKNLGANQAIIQGTPENIDVGLSNLVTITALDTNNATAIQSFGITIINTNDAPEFVSNPIRVADEDSLYEYTIIVKDIDIGASIKITASILSDWLTLEDNLDGTAKLSGIPLNADVGIENAAIITASDGMETVEQSFMIVVNNTNDPPEIMTSPIKQAVEDINYLYTIEATDMDGDAIQWMSKSLPSWLSLMDHGNNTASLQGTPQNADVGQSDPITLIAMDSESATTTQVFTIDVENVNDPPEFISQPKYMATEDQPYAYTVIVSDIDFDAIIQIEIVSLPQWLTMTDLANGIALLTGVPLNDHVHTENIVILTARDGVASAVSQAFMITVINSNDAPTITSAAVLTATEDMPYRYTIVADDMDNDTLHFTAKLPEWLTLINHGDNGATLEGIPRNAHVGPQPLTITAIDPSHGTATQVFDIYVFNTNDPPAFESFPLTKAVEDHLYHYTITVMDMDPGAALSITAVNLPDWLQFTDNGDNTANIKGIPVNSHVGLEHWVVITVTDSLAPEVYQAFFIDVINTNDAPSITSAARLTALEDHFYAYTITAEDMDGDSLFFQLNGPSWLTITNEDNNLAVLSGKPTNDHVGVSPAVHITALDPDHATATQTFQITVSNTNDAPEFVSEPTQVAIEDSRYSSMIRVKDVDQQATIQIHGEKLPQWLTLTDHGDFTASLTGLPENDHVGSHIVMITATDTIAPAISQLFTITVINTNDQPEITSIAINNVDEDSEYRYLLTASDMDGDPLAFRSEGMPSWLTLVNNNDNSASLYGIPKNEHVGQTPVFTLITMDPDFATAEQIISIEVKNTNDAPSFVSQPETVAVEDQTYTHTLKVDDMDPGAAIQFLQPQLPQWLHLTDNDDGTAMLYGIPLNEHVGSQRIVITATDGIALPITQTFVIEIQNTNDPPEITSNPIIKVDEDSRYTYTITGDDPDGDRVEFTATSLPAWLALTDNGNNTAILEGIPTNDNIGQTDPFHIIVSDPFQVIDTQTFQITVTNTNDMPVFTSQPITIAIEDIYYFYLIQVEDMDPNPEIIIEAEKLPSWLTLINKGNGMANLQGYPMNEHVKSHDVKIWASDQISPKIVVQEFSIDVQNTNDPPEIISSIKIQAIEDQLYSCHIQATDMDPNDHLQFISTGFPNWLSLTDNGDRTAVIQGTPTNDFVGVSSRMAVTVHDLAGESDYRSFTIQVENTNDTPEISIIPSQRIQEYASTQAIPFTVKDMDGDALLVQVFSSNHGVVTPADITICEQFCSKGFIQLSPTDEIQSMYLQIEPSKDGIATLTVQASDNDLSASTSFSMTVVNVKIPPQITQLDDIAINEDATAYAIGFNVGDADSDNRNYTITVTSDNPRIVPMQKENISIDSRGLIYTINTDATVELPLYVTPINNLSGSCGITLTVIDADGESTFTTFTLTVKDQKDDPPEICAIAPCSILEDTALTRDFTIMDPDGGYFIIAAHSSDEQIVPVKNIHFSQTQLATVAFEPESLSMTVYPAPDATGNLVVTITARDSENHLTSMSFDLTVTQVNDSPVIVSNFTAITLTEDSNDYRLPIIILDPDGDPLSLQAISGNTELIAHSDIQFLSDNPVQTIPGVAQTVHFNISTQPNAFGTAPISLIITDPSGDSDSTSLTITVTPTNDPPHIAEIAPQFVYEDHMTAPISISISDVESGPIKVLAQSSNANQLPSSCMTFAGISHTEYTITVTAEEPEILTLQILPPSNVNGTITIRLTVFDYQGLTDSIEFPLTIQPINDMPSFTLKETLLEVQEDDPLQIHNNWVTDISTGAQNEIDPLSFNLQTNNEQLFSLLPQITVFGQVGRLSFSPAPNAFGTATVSMSLSDGYSSTTEKLFTITIQPVNDAPDLTTSIDKMQTLENNTFDPIPFSVFDLDDPTLFLSILADHDFFSEIAICIGNDCQICEKSDCMIEYSRQMLLSAALKTLEQLTDISSQLPEDLKRIHNNLKNALPETIYRLNQTVADLSLRVTPQAYQSGSQSITLIVRDPNGAMRQKSITLSVKPVSNPPLLSVINASGLEDEAIALFVSVELQDKDSEELLDIIITGVPEGGSLNKGRKDNNQWILETSDLNYLNIAPPNNSADDILLTVMASAKEKSLTQTASIQKDIFVAVEPIADEPEIELASANISGAANQELPIQFTKLCLTDTDGSEQWSKIVMMDCPPDIQFSKGAMSDDKWIIDLSSQNEFDLSGWEFDVIASQSQSLVMRVLSKESENGDTLVWQTQVNIDIQEKDAETESGQSDDGGGCFISNLGSDI